MLWETCDFLNRNRGGVYWRVGREWEWEENSGAGGEEGEETATGLLNK